ARRPGWIDRPVRADGGRLRLSRHPPRQARFFPAQVDHGHHQRHAGFVFRRRATRRSGQAIADGLAMAAGGADILDVGGESTRPGAEPVSEAEELARVLPVVRGLRRETHLPISIDTYKSNVAKAALDAGADIVNDVSALRFDPAM